MKRLMLVMLAVVAMSACGGDPASRVEELEGQVADPQRRLDEAATSTTDGSGQGDEARTYYESLSLDSPEAAVETFIAAFARSDFMAVFLVLDDDAQFRIQQNMNLFLWDQLVQGEAWDQLREEVAIFSEGIRRTEHMAQWSFFDDLMLAAARHEAFLIDLSGEVTIQSAAAGTPLGDDAVVDVVGAVEGIDGEVIFRTVQAPSGRWRVRQVVVPGGDEEMIPWAVP